MARSSEGPGDSAGDDARLLAGLRAGNEATFREMIRRYHPSMVRFARRFVADEQTADEAVQDTWVAVVGGLDRFEGRSSLRTWIFGILANRARSLAGRRRRAQAVGTSAPSDDPSAFRPSDDDHAGFWLHPPRPWRDDPERMLLSGELRSILERELARLPMAQRQVITLRDVEGWTAREVSDLLEITDANQRVLLHRARVRIRDALASYLSED